METLLAALILAQHNTHVLHWRLTGVDFDPTHSLMDDYYDAIGGFVDEVAEMGMQVDIAPVGLHEVFDVLSKSDKFTFESLTGKESFTSTECFGKIQTIYGTLIALYDDVINNGNLPGDIVNKLQEHQQWFRKQTMYKNRRRLS